MQMQGVGGPILYTDQSFAGNPYCLNTCCWTTSAGKFEGRGGEKREVLGQECFYNYQIKSLAQACFIYLYESWLHFLNTENSPKHWLYSSAEIWHSIATWISSVNTLEKPWVCLLTPNRTMLLDHLRNTELSIAGPNLKLSESPGPPSLPFRTPVTSKFYK